MLTLRRSALTIVVAALLMSACGQPVANGSVIGVRPVLPAQSVDSGTTASTDGIARELARQLQAASDVAALPAESALASSQLALEGTLTIKQLERLIWLQTLAGIEIDARLTKLSQVRSQVVADGAMTFDQKGSVTGIIDQTSAGLKALRVKIMTQDQLVDQARADLTSIGLFRVYGLILPQAHLLIAAYQMQQLGRIYASQRANLQRQIYAQQLTNPDVSPAQGVTNAMAAQVNVMLNASQSAAYALAGLRVGDYPGNLSVVVSARQSLTAAKTASDRAAAYRAQAMAYLGL